MKNKHSQTRQVLIIGDSISEGYTPLVKDLLDDEADVHRPDANCGATILGLKQIDLWLGETKWDVIHFNWGLHDLHRRMNDNVEYAEDAKTPPQVTLPEYEKNLKELVGRLKKTGAKLIWGSTTPVPEGCPCRIADGELKYNEVALKVMTDENVPVDDLCTAIRPRVLEFQIPKDVHFNPEGSRFLAEAVAKSIREQLNHI